MSGSGHVLVVEGASVPSTNRPGRKVLVARDDGTWTSFFIPVGNDPAVGLRISWGPHHVWAVAGDWRAVKLTWEEDPDAPLR